MYWSIALMSSNNSKVFWISMYDVSYILKCCCKSLLLQDTIFTPTEDVNQNNQRPNSKNLSRGSNMRRGSNMVGSDFNCIQCIEIWAGAQLETVYDELATRFKFLNSASVVLLVLALYVIAWGYYNKLMKHTVSKTNKMP